MAYQERYPERMRTTELAKKWRVTNATIRNMIESGQLETLPRKTPRSPYIITSDMACRAQGYLNIPTDKEKDMLDALADAFIDRLEERGLIITKGEPA